MTIDALLAQARQRIASAQHIAVIGHIRPDGDSVGSLLGLGLALQNAGKQVQMVSSDGVPASLKHLPGANQVVKKAKLPLDLIIVVDTASLDRIGDVLAGPVAQARRQQKQLLVDICFDHHPANAHFAALNIVEEDQAAVAAMLTKHLPALGLEIDQQVASALLTGLITDTLGFRTSNVNADALRFAAALVEKGAPLSELYHKALAERTYPAALYWGTGLARLQNSDGIVWTVLSLEDRKAAGYPGNDDAELINVLAAIKEADVALIFIEQDAQHVKVSWRSRNGCDVSGIAASFGGGGHRPAAGAMIAGALDEVVDKVLAATSSYLREQCARSTDVQVNA